MVEPVYWRLCVMAIKMNKRDQLETKSFMVSVKNTKLLEEVFNNHYPDVEGDKFKKGYTLKSQCKTELNSTDTFEVENYTIQSIMYFNVIFSFYIHLQCLVENVPFYLYSIVNSQMRGLLLLLIIYMRLTTTTTTTNNNIYI